jgi:hypothetical protein
MHNIHEDVSTRHFKWALGWKHFLLGPLKMSVIDFMDQFTSLCSVNGSQVFKLLSNYATSGHISVRITEDHCWKELLSKNSTVSY